MSFCAIRYNTRMNPRRARRLLGILILLVSLILLIWGLWPLAIEVRAVPVSPPDMQLPEPGSWLPGLFWVT